MEFIWHNEEPDERRWAFYQGTAIGVNFILAVVWVIVFASLNSMAQDLTNTIVMVVTFGFFVPLCAAAYGLRKPSYRLRDYFIGPILGFCLVLVIPVPYLIAKSVIGDLFSKTFEAGDWLTCVCLVSACAVQTAFAFRAYSISRHVGEERVRNLFRNLGSSLQSQMSQILLERSELVIHVDLREHCTTYSQWNFPTGPSECALCLENYTDELDVVRLPCEPKKHYFHAKCIQVWFKQKLECPLCRRRVAEISTDAEPIVTLIE